MDVRLIQTCDDWAAMGESWNRLLVKSRSASPFLTYEWLSSWWQHYGGDRRLYILAANEDGGRDPVALAPLMSSRIAGFRILEFIGTGPSDHLDFIVDAAREDAADCFVEVLSERKKDWDFIWLRDVPESGYALTGFARNAAGHSWQRRQRRTSVAPYLLIRSDWPDFLAGKSRHFRRMIQQKERHLDRDGFDFEVRCIAAGVEDSHLADLAEVGRKSWKGIPVLVPDGRGGGSGFDGDVLRAFAAKGWLNLWLGYINGRPAVHFVNFDFRNKIWIYNTAFDAAFARYNLGTQLLVRLLEDAFRRRKTECDFLRGDEPYKSLWTSDRRTIYQLGVRRRSARSMAADAAIAVLGRNMTRAARFLRNEYVKRRRRRGAACR